MLSDGTAVVASQKRTVLSHDALARIDPSGVLGKPGMAGRPQHSWAVAGVLAEWLESS